MVQTDELQFDQDFADVVKRNPVAALVIETRYLRRDVNLLNIKVDGISGKRCPCQQVVDQDKAITILQAQAADADKGKSNIVVYLALIATIGLTLIDLYMALRGP
jgi:hypothetical protein